MEPYYSHIHTFGPVPNNAGVDAGGHQFFGAANPAKQPLKRMTVWKLLSENQNSLRLYGARGVGAAGENAAAATAGGATVAILSGAVLTGLAINYGLGRYVGAPIIEYFSGNKLTPKQKNAVGITTMLF